MVFLYRFQDRDGKLIESEVDAPSEAEAFALLRKGGVRPMKVWAKPGEAARVKRAWIMRVSLLALGAAVVICGLFVLGRQSGKASVGHEVRSSRRIARPHPRHQMASVTNDLAGLFKHPSEVLLARYVRPGELPASPLPSLTEELANDLRDAADEGLEIGADDPSEVIELKCVVSGILSEVGSALSSGQSPQEVMDFFEGRQRMEASYRKGICAELERLRTEPAFHARRKEANAMLRSMGMREIGESGF